MYKIKTTTKFEKDLKLLKEVIEILSKGEEYQDHYLQGNYSGFKVYHIKPDWLLEL